jgi:phage-related protein
MRKITHTPRVPSHCNGLGGQVMEIAVYDARGTYRAIYTVSIGEAIYVIHAFQK